MIYEAFRARVIAEYRPAPDSSLMRALLEADELAAAQEAARPAHSAAAERVQALRAVVYKPVPASGLGRAERAEHARRVDELRAAQEAATAAAAELGQRHRALLAKQEEIAAMIAPPAVDDVARRAAVARMTEGAS
jgi:hypothetical protein